MGRPIVLMDVDGVICNFVGGLIRSFNWPITHNDYSSWSHHRKLGLTDEEMWEPTRVDGWWLNLEPYDYAFDFLERVRSLADVVFCTSPSRCHKCPSEKVAWLRKHGFLSDDSTDYQIGPRKELNAKSGAILIDDSDSNVKKYRDAGGTAILFPQPWNSSSGLCGEFVLNWSVALGDLKEVLDLQIERT